MGNDIHALGRQSALVDTTNYQEIKLQENIRLLKRKWALFRSTDLANPEPTETSTKIE